MKNIAKILWADDQIEVAKSFSSILSTESTEIDFVSTGEEALHEIKRKNYDLILLDLAMPPGRWGGIWVLEKLKEISHDASIIIVSGEGGQSETIQALRLGAVDYITKEQLSRELPSQILKILENRDNSVFARNLIATGENALIEFKSTLRFNLHAKSFDSSIELAVLKTIAGFMNASGGHLLIGVGDDSSILGISVDAFKSNDKFELHLRNLIRNSIGAEYSEILRTKFYKIDGKDILLITCPRSDHPIYVSWKAAGEKSYQDLFFVRAGPQTEQLGTKQAVTYIGKHFSL